MQEFTHRKNLEKYRQFLAEEPPVPKPWEQS
jgi:hypothetical protein